MNCGVPRTDRFCGACGQDHHRLRLTTREWFADALDTAFFLNGKVPTTVRALMTRPGTMVRDYVAGKRVPYVTPLKYAFYSATLWYLFVAMVNAGQGTLAEFVAQWGQLFNLLVIPALAFTTWLVMWGARYTFAEQMCFALFVFGHVFLLRGILAAVVLWDRNLAMVATWTDQIGFPIYFVWALVGFHRGRVRYLIPRLVLVLLGVILVSTLFTMAMRWLASI